MGWEVDEACDGTLTGEVEGVSTAKVAADTTTARGGATEKEERTSRVPYRSAGLYKSTGLWNSSPSLGCSGTLLEKLASTTDSCTSENSAQTQVVRSDVCGDSVAAGCSDGTTLIGRLSTNKIEHTIREHAAEEVLSICSSRDGNLVVSGSHDKTLLAWDVAAQHFLFVMSGSIWDETVSRYCGGIAGHAVATSS